MSGQAEQPERFSVDRYLTGERSAEVKSEYSDGLIWAMTGASNRHNLIATNALVAMAGLLRGTPCRVYNSDTKIRVCRLESTWFYYPDAAVICEPNPQADLYQDRPVLVLEVLSYSTRARDLDEKLNQYLSLPSLAYYLVLEQTTPRAVLLRRSSHDFLREVHEGLDATIDLPRLRGPLQLRDLYAEVDFSPAAVREECHEAEYATPTDPPSLGMLGPSDAAFD